MTDGPRTGPRRPCAGLTFTAKLSVHFPASARCPAGFSGRAASCPRPVGTRVTAVRRRQGGGRPRARVRATAQLPPSTEIGFRGPFHGRPGNRCWRGRTHACCRSSGVLRAALIPRVYLRCTRALPPVLARAPRGAGEDGGVACRTRAGTPGESLHPLRGAPARMPAGRRPRLDRYREDVAVCRDGARGRAPGGAWRMPARPGPRRDCRRSLAAGDGLRPGSGSGHRGTVRGAGRPFGQVREPAAIPHRQLICTPFRIPADTGSPGPGKCAGRGGIKPSCGIPDLYKRTALKNNYPWCGGHAGRYVNSSSPVRGPGIRTVTGTHPVPCPQGRAHLAPRRRAAR